MRGIVKLSAIFCQKATCRTVFFGIIQHPTNDLSASLHLQISDRYSNWNKLKLTNPSQDCVLR